MNNAKIHTKRFVFTIVLLALSLNIAWCFELSKKDIYQLTVEHLQKEYINPDEVEITISGPIDEGDWLGYWIVTIWSSPAVPGGHYSLIFDHNGKLIDTMPGH